MMSLLEKKAQWAQIKKLPMDTRIGPNNVGNGAKIIIRRRHRLILRRP